MTTDLIEVKNNMPAFLQNAKADNEEFIKGLTGGLPLPTISIRGKEFRLRKDGQEVPTRQRDLEAIFVAGRPGISKRYYEGKYTSGETDAPDCSSADGITPDVADPVAPSCKTCPNNVWGSRITEGGKEGKACSDYKRIVVLPLFNGKPASEPMILDLPATSLKRPKSYKGNEMMFAEYTKTLVKHDMPLQGVVTNLGFTDAEYPQLCFAYSRFVNEQEYATALKMRELEDVQEVLGGGFEAHGPNEEQAPASEESEPHKEVVEETKEDERYPETLAELKTLKIKPLRELAESLGVDAKLKKPELIEAVAEELELTEAAAPKQGEIVSEPEQQEVVSEPEPQGGEEDEDEVLSELESMLNG